MGGTTKQRWPHASRAWRRGSDNEGFTLLELLIALSIIPLVIGGIAIATISSFHNETATTVRLADSHDAQITSAYFVRDVQAAQLITTSPTSTFCPPGGAQPQLLGLSWTLQTGTGPKTYSVSYGLSTGTSSPFLVRSFCVGGALVDTTVLSNDPFTGLPTPTISNSCTNGASSCATSSGQTDVTVTVQCQATPMSQPPGNGGTVCANVGPIPTYPTGLQAEPGISSVAITVTEYPSGFRYTLTAAPRNQGVQTAEPPGSGGPALVLLGTSDPALNCANKTPIQVNGSVAVDSIDPNSLQFGPHSSMTATEVYTEPLVPAGSTLSGFSGKTVQGPPFPDPYASVPDPTSSNVYGVGQNTIINPGEYLGPVTVGPGTTALTPGIYIFEQGLTVAGTATLTGKGVMLFIGVPNAVPGVPQPNAAFTVQGNGEVNITPQLSGTYQGISVFQSRSDANPMVIAGNGSGNIYGGLIYAPAANVGISGNGAVAAGEVVAGAVGGNGTCGGNSQFSVGFAVLLSTPQSATIPSGGNNSDNVEVVGSPGRGAPQGTITFYVCNPTIAPGSCTSLNGTSVGSASLNPGADVTSTATSPTSQFPLSGAMPGTWCYAAYYGGDPNYGTSNDTTPDGCFTVDGPTASFTFPVQVTPIPTYHLTGNSSWKALDSCSPSPSQNMCGTVADVGGGSITGVAYFIAQTGGGCWNGSTWSGACNFTPVSNFTSGGTTWAQTWAQSNFVAGNTYTLSIQVTDSAKLVTVASTSFKIAS